ncbi:hypothetical protein K3723_05100 [Leisingera caerulea]|uniref:hypothetical protein n=1 Tax=Leisingera caerulea TaxID=506591 RepID=UPI0021A5DDFD|nr:hypothetical protein [Leisingera caerulea]UWQ64635.1 hypothetical protein K3723_05100 [Leisingera caerulea]
MSDPVTHAEIEDVLSSIRRLVSEDSRGQPAAPEPAAKLVLTPALRVKDPQARSPEAAEGPKTGAGAPHQETDPGQASAGTAPLSADAQPQTADAPLEAEAAAAGQAEHADPAKHAEHAADVEHEADEAAAQPAVPFRHRQARAASGPALLLSAQQDAADTEAEAAQPGGAETCQPQPAPVRAGAPDTDPDKAPWADPDATLFSAASGTPPQDRGTGDTAAETPTDGLAGGTAGARAASVVRKIAELEARSSGARGQAQPQWEPDSKTEAPFAATLVDTIEWRDQPAPARSTAQAASDASGETDGSAETAAETAQPAAADSAAETVVEAAFAGAALETLAESGDSYLDEEGLRDLVASIVREELQGPLGERITRNVRKLVRREIHRALAAHDLL